MQLVSLPLVSSRAPHATRRSSAVRVSASAVELAQLATVSAEIAEVASTCFIITLVVRACEAALTPKRANFAVTGHQGLAIGFVLLRVEASVEGDAE